jgi:hypothetical protein
MATDINEEKPKDSVPAHLESIPDTFCILCRSRILTAQLKLSILLVFTHRLNCTLHALLDYYLNVKNWVEFNETGEITMYYEGRMFYVRTLA